MTAPPIGLTWRVAAGALVVVIALAAQIVVLDRQAPELMSGGRPITVGLPSDARVSQHFGIVTVPDVLHVPMTFSASPGAGYIEASLYALGDGEPARLGDTRVRLAGHAIDCCAFPFQVAAARGEQRLRLDLIARDLPPSAGLELPVRAVRTGGGLEVNGHAQPANVLLDASRGPVSLPGEVRRVSLVLVLSCLAVLDAAIVVLLSRLRSIV